MIVIENLSKRYADRTVVRDVTFDVKQGEILGFLGPNGAGKSTTMKMLTGYLTPTAGRVEVGGFDMAKDPIKAKSLIGYLPENPPVYPEMTVRDYLAFAAKLRGVPGRDVKAAVDEVIARCILGEVPNKLIAHLSKGFQQRVGIAQALVHKPKVIILDEPTNGLDPKQIIQIRELIKGLAQDHTVILSTHILPEVQVTCSRVLIINQGTVVAEGKPEELEGKLRGGMRIELEARAPQGDISTQLQDLPGVSNLAITAKADGLVRVSLEVPSGNDLRERIAAEVVGRGWGLLELKSVGLSLEEIFLKLTTADAAQTQPQADDSEVLTHG
ncbi:putative ABC transporter ATP-binding protein YxlF [compost metagenome]